MSTRTAWSSSRQSGEVAILCRYLEELVPVRLTYLEPKPGFKWSNPPENNYVDKHVFTKLKMLNIQPSELCSDQEFIRRAYLDVCGMLPSPKEVATFLDSKDADKRAKLIDQLLERPEYADFWTLKWSDVFRSAARRSRSRGRTSSRNGCATTSTSNDGFDQIVYEVITAGGSTFANPPRTTTASRAIRPRWPRRRPSSSSASACSAPSATIIRSSAGRRMTTTAWPRSSPA